MSVGSPIGAKWVIWGKLNGGAVRKAMVGVGSPLKRIEYSNRKVLGTRRRGVLLRPWAEGGRRTQFPVQRGRGACGDQTGTGPFGGLGPTWGDATGTALCGPYSPL